MSSFGASLTLSRVSNPENPIASISCFFSRMVSDVAHSRLDIFGWLGHAGLPPLVLHAQAPMFSLRIECGDLPLVVEFHVKHPMAIPRIESGIALFQSSKTLPPRIRRLLLCSLTDKPTARPIPSPHNRSHNF
jgi:hypothetical protein